MGPISPISPMSPIGPIGPISQIVYFAQFVVYICFPSFFLFTCLHFREFLTTFVLIIPLCSKDVFMLLTFPLPPCS